MRLSVKRVNILLRGIIIYSNNKNIDFWTVCSEMKFLLGSRVVSIRVHLAGNTLRVSKSCQQKQLEEEEMQKIEGNLLSKLELYELLHFLSCFGCDGLMHTSCAFQH